MIAAGAAWAATRAFLAKVPPIVWLLLLVAVLIVLGALSYGSYREEKGATRVQAEWDKARAKANSAQQTRIGRRNIITTKIERKVVKEIRYIDSNADSLSLELPNYVNAHTDSCRLSGGFRLYHDAAAAGQARPDTDPAGIASAASVAADTVARTVGINYQRCLTNAKRLDGWNDWWDRLEADQRKELNAISPAPRGAK